jgi:type 2 lantibiotic biosynthesis protein LanM
MSAAEAKMLLQGDGPLEDLPQWVGTFRSIYVDVSTGSTTDGVIRSDCPRPFEELHIPAITFAHESVTERANAELAILDRRAVVALEQDLLSHLAFVSSGVIGEKFYQFRFTRVPSAAFEDLYRDLPPTHEIYREFVEEMRNGRLLQLFDEYPVLARLISNSVEQWVTNVANLCSRFLRDAPGLSKLLEYDLDPLAGVILDAHSELSDRHDGGSTAVAITLRHGNRLVYKPRGADGELAWRRVIDRIARKGVELEVGSPAILDRRTHHWSTWVPSVECVSSSDVDAFYERAGATIAVLHALAVTDIHCENLIASGPHPVVVDLEMLLNPGPSDVDDSLDRTGMVPTWNFSELGHPVDLSALGAGAELNHDVDRYAWCNINTDQMMRVAGAAEIPTLTHRVRLGSAYPPVSEHVESLLHGFTALYGELLVRREQIVSDRTINAALSGLELRVLLRDSATYADLLTHLLEGRFLRNGLDRSIEIEWLARPLGVQESCPEIREAIYEFERASIEFQDVPRFTTTWWKRTFESEGEDELRPLGIARDASVLVTRLKNFSEAALQSGINELRNAVEHSGRASAPKTPTP